MKTFTINTIQDIQGNKLVLTDENGISKCWYGQFYSFEREIKQVNGVEVYQVKAEGFQHAIDLINLKKELEQSRSNTKNLRLKLNKLEATILRKLGKKLRGLKDRTKINSFLR